MSDVEEDPYAVSSDSEDEKGPPPKIAIETTADLNQLKQALTADEKKPVKDEKTLEEIEELRKAKQEELSRVKREFEEGRASALQQLEGASVQKESLEGVGKENLISMKNMFENEPNKEFVRDANIGEELAQLSSLKEKKESWQTSAAEAQVGQRSSALLTPEELAAAGTVKGNKERFTSGIDTTAPVDDEEKRRQLEEIKSQVSEVKQKWRTGNVEGADMAQDDAGKREELEALKGVNIRERFQPPAEGEVQKCYDRSELDTSGAADARKSFLEGSAYASAKAESAAAGELNELKFTELNAYKDKFERGQGDAEEVERAKVELDLQLKELRKTFEKPESEMSPAERAAKKKAEIEAEFARYKLARKLQEQRAAQNEAATAELEKKADGTGADLASSRAAGGAEEEFDVKNLMAKFANLSDLSGAKAAGGQQRNLEDLEALRVEAKNLREQFEKANQLEASETAEEKRRRLEEEFKQLKEERERARQELEAEQAETAAAMAAAGKEDIQVAADHAAKMTAKWEKIHKKEAKKAEKGRMPQKAGAGGGDQS